MISLQSAFFRLNKNDLIKSLFIAFLAPILVSLSTALSVPGFTFDTLDFSMLYKIGLASMISYLIKNFFSDENGHIMGRIG